MDRTEENKFFSWFGHDGAFDTCLTAMQWKYDLGDCKGFYSDATKEDIDKCLQYALSKCGELSVDLQPMYEEIEDNFLDCSTEQSKESYCQDLLRPFSRFAHSVLPVKNNFPTIGERANEIEKGFLDILHKNIEENSIESYFRFFYICVREYSIMLDWVLIKHGIDLMIIQDKLNIHIKNGRRIFELSKWGGNLETVQYYLSSLQKNVSKVATPALDQVFINSPEGLRNKFIAFVSVSKREGKELDATNVVLLLKMILKHDLADKLKSNRFNIKQLWSELRQLKLIRDGIEDNNLDKARRNPKPPATEVVESWNRFLTSEAK